MTTFMQYKHLMKMLLQNMFSFNKLAKSASTKKAKLGMIIGMIFAFGILAIYIIINIAALTVMMVNADMFSELIYLMVLSTQIVVLFFGGLAVMSYLYFSTDNALLASLPLNTKAVFMAKFSMAYLAEVFISSLMTIPILTTVAITASVKGVAIAWHFYIIQIFVALLTPIIPLLLVTLLSMPAMYIVSFLRKRSIGNSIVLTLFYVLLIFASIAMSGVMSGIQAVSASGEGLPKEVLSAFSALKKYTVFNYPIAEALLNNSTIVNLLVYTAGIAVVLTLAIMLSMVFYKRIFAINSESVHSNKKKKKGDIDIASSSIFKTFMQKEIKTLINSPMLLVQMLIAIVLCPIMVFVMGKVPFTFEADEGHTFEFANYVANMANVGMITYMVFMVGSATNMVAMIGISREGKGLFILKALPVSVKTLLDSKLYFATAINLANGVLCTISFIVSTKIYNPIAWLGLLSIVAIGGFAMNCRGLKNDLKNPRLNWTNVNELTRNNTRTIKPMLKSMLLGFLFLIFGIVLALQSTIKGSLAYIMYFGICLTPLAIMAYTGYRKLYETAEADFENIEGNS